MPVGRYNGAHGSPASRSSRVKMPPIAEDEDAARDPPTTAPRHPRTPLRIPQRAANQSAPPPYVPVTHISPPRYRDSSTLSDSSEGRRSSELKLEQQQLHAAQMQKAEGGNRFKQLTEKQWFGSRRKRWTAFICLGLLSIGLIVGLAVGLTLGLKNGNDGSKGEDEDPENMDRVFPAGSYAFQTTLQDTSSSCTSHASTWRCYPYEQGSNATFFWIIDAHDSPDSDDPSYTVSSSDNPFAPSFKDLNATLLEPNTPNERLTFSYDMDKTVIPSDSLTPTNQAAQCTFRATKFEATLWTRRRDDQEIDTNGTSATGSSTNYAPWPANVEVSQVKTSEQGEPQCEDRDGNLIADVQASDGDCVCGYASFQEN